MWIKNNNNNKNKKTDAVGWMLFFVSVYECSMWLVSILV